MTSTLFQGYRCVRIINANWFWIPIHCKHFMVATHSKKRSSTVCFVWLVHRKGVYNLRNRELTKNFCYAPVLQLNVCHLCICTFCLLLLWQLLASWDIDGVWNGVTVLCNGNHFIMGIFKVDVWLVTCVVIILPWQAFDCWRIDGGCMCSFADGWRSETIVYDSLLHSLWVSRPQREWPCQRAAISM